MHILPLLKKLALTSVFAITFLHFTFSQTNLNIFTQVPLVGENRFSICGGEKFLEVRIENITPLPGQTTENMVVTVDLSSVPGFMFSGTLIDLGGVGVSILDAGIPTFSINNMNRGDTARFRVGLEVDCKALPKVQSGTAANFNIDVDYTIGGAPFSQLKNTGNFEIVKPALSIPSILGNPLPGKTGAFVSLFDAAKNSTDTIKVSIVNAGDGSLTHFVYWVKDHPLLTNTGVYVGSYMLPVLGTNGDTTFYSVNLNAIAKATAGPYVNDTSNFQFNEVLVFKEVWFVDDCSNSFPDIIRGARYGCDGTVLAKCEQTSRTSGLRFGFKRPVLTTRTTWDLLTPAEYAEGLPACYFSTKPKQRVIIFNSGTAYADSINFSLSAYRGDINVNLDTASVTIRTGKFGAPIHISPNKVWMSAQSGYCPLSTQQLRTADYRLNDFQLKPGDTLWIEFQMEYTSCGCSLEPGYCDMQNWYFGILNWGSTTWASPASYQDPCHLNKYNLEQINTTDWRGIQSMFVEGPVQLLNDQVGTETYTSNATLNSWLGNRSSFPDGIFRVEYYFDKGLDWNGVSGDLTSPDVKFYGRNGVVWDPVRVLYTDHGSAGPDTLFVDYSFSNFPSTFVYADGMQYKLKVKADCGETGPPCAQGTIAHTKMRVYFSPSASCTDCGKGQLVTCLTDIDTEIKCPTCGPCEGLYPLSFNIDRLTLELPDNDNNYQPDPTGSINPALVALDRFISGDTLKAVYRGVFRAGVVQQNFEAAFSVMQLPTGFDATITPLGGAVRIIKSGGATYEADLVQQFPNGNQVITNLHPGNLNYLGNPVPADLVYENNDTVEVTVLFAVSDPTFNVYTDGNVNKPLIIDDYSFATHDTLWDVAPADRYACEDIRDRVYYIEMKHLLSSSNGTNTGGCTLGHNGYDWTGFFIGSNNLDYFPFEYRTPKAHPVIHRTYLAAGLVYDRYRWHYYAKDYIARPNPVGQVPLNSGVYGDLDSPGSIGQGYYWGELPITSPYITIIGDTLYFRSYDFLKDNFGELIADEGYRFVGYARFRGNCNSMVTPINGISQKPRYWFDMDPKVFGYSTLEAGRVAYSPSLPPDNSNQLVYGYTGAPNLSIQAPIKTQSLISEFTCFEVQLINSSDYSSSLTWLTVTNESGSVLIQSVRDITNPAAPITYTPTRGIYQIGAMNSAVGGNPYTRIFEICVIGNSCALDSFVVNTGWECKAYPYSIAEATCNNPQTLYLEPIGAELGMVIKHPETSIIADLCTEQDYVIQLSSTILGSLQDIHLQFNLPDGQEYVPGSFEIAYPPPASGNYNDAVWESSADPINTFGNDWEINVSQQDPVLASSGMPGTLQLGLNYAFVRFNTRTTCNYASGGKVRFLSWAYNACDELVNYKFSPAGALKIAGLPEIYKTEVQLNADTLNPCNMDQAQINVEFAVSTGSVPTASKDSIIIKLPLGVHYVSGSFMNIMNAGSLPPVIELVNGQENLIWDVVDGLTESAQVKFKFFIEAVDAQQECRTYPIVAYTFSSKEALCVSNMTSCAVRAISDETEENITFVKPNVSLSNFNSSTRAILPNMEEVCYTLQVKNTGEDAPAGTPLTVEVYAEDGDGDLDAGDVLLFKRTFSVTLTEGDSLTLMACDTVMAGTTCRLMAVLNPESSCVCEVMTSFLSYPSLTQAFVADYNVCSDELLTQVGPSPLTKGVDYQWLTYEGSNVSYFLTPDTTQSNFKARNTSGINFELDYLLRTTRNNQCVDYDTIHITVFPEIVDSIAFQVCLGPGFDLAGPTTGSNYQWTPAHLVVNPNNPFTAAYGISAPTRYRLDYTDANGCPAIYIANVDIVECGNTALGDTVWIDYNYNGIQDVGEPGLANVQVYLYNANDLTTPISGTNTDAQGFYIFDTIPAADYVIRFVLPDGATFTLNNIGSDTDDSDANTGTGFTSNYYVPNGVRNLDFDAGIVFFDWADAPNNYKTTLSSGGPRHVIIPNLYLGSIVDAESNGQPVALGSAATGDDLNSFTSGDDEDGLVSLPALGLGLVGDPYTISIKATNLTGKDAYLVAWIDFNRDLIFSPSEGLKVTVPDGTNNGTFNLTYTVPANLTTGISYVRLRLSQDPALTVSTPAGLSLSGEVEDYELMINDKFVDLALTKVINTTVSPGPFGPGSSVTFKITVTNQGNLDATNVQLVDYLPAGLSLNDSDWAVLSGSKVRLVSPLPLVRAGLDTMVDITCTIDPSFRGSSLVNYAEITSSSNIYGWSDIDSQADTTRANDAGGVPGTTTDNMINNNGTLDEDDQDPAFVPIIDMALKKLVATAPPYTYGQLLDFTIRIYNQGTVIMQNTTVKDYIPSGYTYASADNPGWTGSAPMISFTYAPRINPGDSASITLKLRIVASSGASAWNNYAEITEIRDSSNTLVNTLDADSNPNSNGAGETSVTPGSTNDDNISSTNKGADEDDHDPAGIQVFDLAMKKVISTPAPYRIGDAVTYNHWIYNQGNVIARNINIIDSIPCGLSYIISNSPLWTYNVGAREATTTIPGPLNPGDSISVPITLQIQSCTSGGAYTNISEINSAADQNLSPRTDIDSYPDGNQNNDGTPIDNATTNPADQDDHDPETLEIWDLALKKQLVTAGPYVYGQTLTFRIKVFNQGTIAATNIEVTDYIPIGFLYLSAENPSWSGASPTVTRTISSVILPGDSSSVDIILHIAQTSGSATGWVNFSQITGSHDLIGNERTLDDADSEAGSSYPGETGVALGSTGDDLITGSNPGANEDDHDPAGIQIFDLALTKTIVNPKSVWKYGDTVCFEVKVYNQGSITASDVTILDHVPCGYEFLNINEPAWIFSSGSRIAQMTLSGNILPGDSVSYQIKLKVQPCNTTGAYINRSEIFRAEDAAGNNMTLNDIDSRPDNNPINDAGGVPGTTTDNHISDDGRDTNGDGITDEDDADPEMIQLIDMALRKTTATAGPYSYGQLITFNIRIYNQGSVPMQNTQVTDYVPAGFTYASADNPGWTGAAPSVNYVYAPSINPGDSAVITIKLRLTPAYTPNAFVNYAEITEIRDNTNTVVNGKEADSTPGSNSVTERNVLPGTLNDDNISSLNQGGEEDDHDPAGVDVFDLAMKKVKPAASSYVYGDNITFSHWVYNQGNVVARNISLVDSIPCGLVYQVVNSPVWTYNSTTREAITTISGPLNPGDSVNVDIVLQLQPCTGTASFTNISEITAAADNTGAARSDIDSNPDGNQNNDGLSVDNATTNPADQDDHDPEMLDIWDLAVKKQLVTAGPYSYGQTLSFRIKVFNQGSQAAQNIVVNDYIPAGFMFAAASNPAWSGTAPTVTATIAGPLNPGDSTFIDIQLILVRTTGGSQDWYNYAEINSSQDLSGADKSDSDIDSEAGSDGTAERNVIPGSVNDDNISSIDQGAEEDDHDPAGIEVFDLALKKIKPIASSYTYGDLITYSHWIYNQGSIVARNIAIVDSIPCGLNYQAVNSPLWTYNSLTREAVTTVAGPLNPGDSVKVDIVLQLQACTGKASFTNISEITGATDGSGNPVIDMDSNPDANQNNDGVSEDNAINSTTDQDDHDPEMLDIWDLAVKKQITTAGPYFYGQTHNFRIKIFNQGSQSAQNIEVTDYIPSGYSYVAANNPIWSGAAPTVTTTIAGPVLPGDSTYVDIELILENTSGGESQWVNYSEITGSQDIYGKDRTDQDIDSEAGSNGTNEMAVLPGSDNDDNIDSHAIGGDEDDHDPAGIEIFDIALKKQLITSQINFRKDDQIRYAITVYNQGNLSASNIVVIDRFPCGFNFISDPILNPEWTNPSSGIIEKTIASLLPGESIVLDVYFTIDVPSIDCPSSIDTYKNVAEVKSALDPSGGEGDDIDSDPNSNTEAENGVIPDSPGDDVVDVSDPSGNQDDHDPADLSLFDLALRKTVDLSYKAEPYNYGDVLKFDITLVNQGNICVDSVKLADNIPSGFVFNPALNPNWSLVGSVANYTFEDHRLCWRDSVTVPIYLTLTQSLTPDAYLNYAEIAGAIDTTGRMRTEDNDSYFDTDPGNDSGGVANTTDDDNLFGMGPDRGEDEDDHDPALVEVFDLALRKLVVDAAPYLLDEEVTYTLEVHNQGNVAAGNIGVVDYIPCGFEFVPASNPGWTLTGNMATYLLAGPIAPLNFTTVSIKLKVKACNAAGAYENIAEITSAEDGNGNDRTNDDADSQADNDPSNDDDPIDNQIEDPADQDDHDPELIPVADLALKKLVVEPSRIYLPDETVDFKIVVYNQGNIDAYNINVSEYIPAGYDFDTQNETRSPAWVLSSGVATAVINGPIAAQDSAVLDFSLIIRKGFEYPEDYVNSAEISSFEDENGVSLVDMDSDADTDPTNDGPVKDDEIDNTDNDEDDSDTGLPIFQIYDLALTKSVDPNQYAKVGELLNYHIKVINQGLNGTVTNVTIVEYIPAGLSFEPAANTGWVLNGSYAEYTIAGPISDGEEIEVPIALRVLAGANPDNLVNYAEIKYFEDEDGVDVTDREFDSTPDDNPTNDVGGGPGTPDDDRTDGNGIDDEDDHDGAVPQIFDLAMIKRTSQATAVRVGDDVPFTITIFNQGNVDAEEIEVLDQIPAGYILSPADANSWTALNTSQATKSIAGPLLPGDSIDIQIVLRVVPGAKLANLVNSAEILSAQDPEGNIPPDMDSQPDDDQNNDGNIIDDEIDECCGIDEDDTDIAVPPVMDLALRKTADRNIPVRAGDIIRFKIEIFNQGNIIAENTVMLDYLDLGYAFDQALNPLWSANGSYVIYNMNVQIAPGSSDSVFIYLRVLPTATTITLVNRAEILSMEDANQNDMSHFDIDSDPDNDPVNDSGGDPYGLTNDAINGDGTGPIGAGLPIHDEDDMDVEGLILCGGISCKGDVNFSLDANCEGVLTPGALLSPVSSPLFAYFISVKDLAGNPHPNYFTSDDVGKCFNVTILDTLCYSNTCWSRVCIEDKLAPVIVCKQDTVSCIAFEDPNLLPEVLGDCSGVEIKLVDESIVPLHCDPLFVKRVERKYVAIDRSGNISDTCTWVLFVERINIYETDFPRDTIFECSDTYAKDAQGNPLPSEVGVPSFNGDTIWPYVDLLCNINVTYEDFRYPEISCSTRILRTWTVREWWCNREISYSQPQWITIIDTTGPVISKGPYDMTVTTESRSCNAKVVLPAIEVSDDCHRVIRVDIAYPGGLLQNQNGGVISLPVGVHEIQYRAYDSCYNQSIYSFIITVKDQTQPVAVCDRRTVVALNHSGFNWVPAEVFDDGSFDECGMDHFEVRRMDESSCGTLGPDDWGPEVGFCCEDVGREIMVGFKVVDHSGNESICMVLVEVQDKDKPIVTPLPDITVDCRFPIDLTNLGSSFGNIVTQQTDRKPIVIDPIFWHEINGHPLDGLVEDNCPPLVEEIVNTENLNQCGLGVIERKFIFSDMQGNKDSTSQLITVINHESFDATNIIWPLDFDTSGICDPDLLLPELLNSLAFNGPQFDDDVCSLVGVSYKDHVFSPTRFGDPCFKIFRVWSVIDWCQSVNKIPVIYTDTQVIRILNEIPPTILDGCNNDVVCSYDINCSDIPYTFLIKAEDDCTAPEEMLYTFRLDLNSDGTIDIVNSALAGYMVSGNYPAGIHTARWEVEDRCGNIATCEYKVELKNCKAPVAYCIYGVAIGLVPMDLNGNGRFDPYPIDIEIDTVWAKDLDAGSYQVCGNKVKLSFSADTNDIYRVFTCDSIGQRFVELWVTDENGNQDFCKTYVLVQDNNQVNICEDNTTFATISGQISTDINEKVENVGVSLEQSNQNTDLTNYEGIYEFDKMPIGGNYFVAPYKNDDWLNGITTADIVKIQKHILGVEPITSPYKMIAADVNRNGTVTANDISELRKLILGVTTQVVKNTSWRFVESEYTFADPESALQIPFPEKASISQLVGDMKLDFKAVKIGDLNGTVRTRGANGGIQVRQSNALQLEIPMLLLSKDQVVEIPFSSKNFDEYAGFQMTLEYDASLLQLMEINGNASQGFSQGNYHIHPEKGGKGRISMSYNGDMENGSPLFTLVLKARGQVSTGQAINISSNITPALAVSNAEGVNLEDRVELKVIETSPLTFEVYQNEPNPWNVFSEVRVQLPNSGEVGISIYNAAGKVFFKDRRIMSKGLNSIRLDDQMLPVEGVYYYQIDYLDQSVTKKMVKLK